MLCFGEATAGKINTATPERAQGLEETLKSVENPQGMMSAEIREAGVWANGGAQKTLAG